MPTDALRDPDAERSRVVVWFDDEPETFERLQHQLHSEELKITLHVFRAFEVLERDASDVARYSRDHPFIACVITPSLPPLGTLVSTLSKLEVRGVVSDLKIGGDSLAGLTLLSHASSLPTHPTLALCSSHIDPSVERLARGIGITALVEKRDIKRLRTLFHDLLNLRQFAASRRVQHMIAECEELRRQNLKLQRQMRAVKKQLKVAQLRMPNVRPVKANRPASVGLSDAGGIRDIRELVLSHNHDLANTSSLTVTTLEHLCADTNIVPPVLLPDLQRARITAKHCDILVQSLASLSGKEAPITGEPSQIESVVMQACEIIARKVPSSVSIKTNIPERLPACSIPSHLLIRALLNLVLNALEAMPRGGMLTIAARRVRGATRPISLQVSDTGAGIKKNDLSKVFTADFSTKGKGHGFGLFIVRQIVTEYGGLVAVTSKRGKGATVALRLPSL